MIELFLKALITSLLVALVWQQTKRIAELERALRLNVSAMEDAIKIQQAARHLLYTLEFNGNAEVLAAITLTKLLGPEASSNSMKIKVKNA